ncbi:MAG: hypothetical protein ACAH83_19035 [Alphaproteobacteria bacterium]
MLKKYLKCESGEADSGVVGGVFITVLFIAVACIGIALTYGIKLNNIVSTLTSHF